MHQSPLYSRLQVPDKVFYTCIQNHKPQGHPFYRDAEAESVFE